MECKGRISDKVAEVLTPFREQRSHFESHINEVKDVLDDGEKRARVRAQQTMADVHAAMSLG